jgi:hypothetical protein
MRLRRAGRASRGPLNADVRFHMKRLCFFIVAMVAAVSAHAEFSNYAQVSCNEHNLVVTISELQTEDEAELIAVPGTQSVTLRSLVRLVSDDRGDFLIKDHHWKSSCVLGAGDYALQISPWKYNAKINGLCGALDPSIELSVSRNGIQLIERLVFSGSCDGTWNEKLIIESVSFDELGRIATFVVTNSGDERQEVKVPYLGLEKIGRHELWTTSQRNLTMRWSGP